MNVKAFAIGLAIILATGLGFSQSYVAKDYKQNYPELFGDEARPTIVVLKATWCGPCKIHGTTVVTLRNKEYRVETYDIDEHKELHEFFGKPQIPYTALLKNGEIKHHWTGITNWRRIAREAGYEYRKT